MDRRKDKLYELLSDFNADSVAKFLKENKFERQNLDFKQAWIEKGKLAKILLALANSGGGIVVVGIKENDDHTVEPCGIDAFKDETEVRQSVKKYIPDTLLFSVENYEYATCEYAGLVGKKIQLIVVQDVPECLPFLSESEGDGLRDGSIYVRNGTACQLANNNDIQKLLNRRLKTGVISELDLELQLKQLKTLYRSSDNKMPTGFVAPWENLFRAKGPEEYNDYIDEIIDLKKKLIEKDLGIYR